MGKCDTIELLRLEGRYLKFIVENHTELNSSMVSHLPIPVSGTGVSFKGFPDSRALGLINNMGSTGYRLP